MAKRISKRSRRRSRTHTLLQKWSVELVERRFDLEPGALSCPRRGDTQQIIVRQIASYILTTAAGASYAQAGRAVRRHGSTVSHSIRQVEEMREDMRLDSDIRALERGVEQLRQVLEMELA